MTLIADMVLGSIVSSNVVSGVAGVGPGDCELGGGGRGEPVRGLHRLELQAGGGGGEHDPAAD